MPQVNILPIEPVSTLDSKGVKADVLSIDGEGGRRFSDEFERQLAADDSGKKHTSNNENIKKEWTRRDHSEKTAPQKEESSTLDETAIDPTLTSAETSDESTSEASSSSEVASANGEEALFEEAPDSIKPGNTTESKDDSHNLLSFLSAAAKLIPEDEKIKRVNSQVGIESEEQAIDIDSKTKDNVGVKTPIDESILTKLSSQKYTERLKDSSESLEQKIEGGDVTKNSDMNLKNQNLLSHNDIRQELKKLMNSEGASVKSIEEAQVKIDTLLAEHDGELSLEKLQTLLAKDAQSQKNPILKQFMQLVNSDTLPSSKGEAQLTQGLAEELVISDEESALSALNEMNKSATPKEVSSVVHASDNKASDAKKVVISDSKVFSNDNKASDANNTEPAETLDALNSDVQSNIRQAFSGTTPAAQTEKPGAVNVSMASTVAKPILENASLASSEQNGANEDKQNPNQALDALLSKEGEAIDSLTPKDEKLFSQNTPAAPMNRVDSHNTTAPQVINESTRSEQSLDSLLNMIQSDTSVQAPKTLTPQQTEVISIYRKDFSNAVKEKVMVMINQKLQQVDIQLDPPEMGNMQVRVNLQNEQAVVTFNVQNQQAKDALEQNMGKLKDMLAQNGVDVGDANVNQQSSNEGENTNTDGSSHLQIGQDEQSEELMAGAQTLNVMKASSTGVDYYA